MISSKCLCVVVALPICLVRPGFGAESFVKRKIEGFTVFVSSKAIAKAPAVTKQALAHMKQQLFQITVALPPKAVSQLKRVPIWLAAGEKKLGIAFHPARSWLTGRGYKPPAPKSLIGIVSGKHFLHEALRQPWLTFHELTHGYDWFTLGNLKQYGNQLNADGYRQAMKSGKYKSALHWNSRRRKPYHATNKMEFFAETSEAFFGTNDIFPFVRAELRDHDPASYRMVAALWGVNLADEHKREAELAKALTRPSRTVKQPGKKHSVLEIEGWQVWVDSTIDAKRKPRLLRVLERDLHYVTRYIPPKSLTLLRKTKIWLSRDDGSAHVGRQRTSADIVVIGNAANYMRFASLQPSALLKQLAHLHYAKLSAKQRARWQESFVQRIKQKSYQRVLRFDGKRLPHPGLRHAKTMFAELSTTRFGTNDHFPFVTAELKDIDPQGHKLLTEIWNGK